MTKRSSIILFLALAASAALFAGSYMICQKLCAKKMARTADDLDWLRHGLNLGDAEMNRVRELHDGYMSKCAEMCKEIAVKKRELESALAGATNLTATAEQKLSELGALRSQCQTQMLRHFVEVSQAMPPEQGRRYLAEMQRLTLGFHDQIEQSMSHAAGHEHGHH
jgi:hypothetical protein